LQAKWIALAKQDEYAETRIISPILFNKSKSTPVNTSILSDNLRYFEANYEKEYADNLLKALTLACLCGSKNVADFLLRTLGKTYLSEGRETKAAIPIKLRIHKLMLLPWQWPWENFLIT